MSIAGVAVAGWLSGPVLRGLDAGGRIVMLAGAYAAVALLGADAAPDPASTQTSAPGPA